MYNIAQKSHDQKVLHKIYFYIFSALTRNRISPSHASQWNLPWPWLEPDPVHSPLLLSCLSYDKSFFLSYACLFCHMLVIFFCHILACHTNTYQVSYLWSICHILVISLSYPNLKKTYLVYTNQYQTSKRYANPQKDVQSIFLVYVFWFRIAYTCHMPCISLSQHFSVPLNAAANEIQPVIELQFDFCITWHSVNQAQQDLFATCAPEGSFARSQTQTRRRGLRHLGLRRRWGRRRGATCSYIGGFLGVLARARGLYAFTPLTPVMPINSL